MNTAFSIIIRFLVRIYQKTISPNHGIFQEYFAARGIGCRFHPSCSEYFLEAIQSRGILKGTLCAVKRIIRCNPRK